MTRRKRGSTAKRRKRAPAKRKAASRRGPRRRPPFALLVGLVLVGGAAMVAALTWGAEAPAEETALLSLPEGRIRVEVLNAGGVQGMARDATEWLRELGFDVVDVGNAASFDPERESVVIDRVGRADMAQAVADALGIDIVRSEPDPNLYVDVSVLLGSEWTRPDLRAGSSGAPERAPWDPRGWLGR